MRAMCLLLLLLPAAMPARAQELIGLGRIGLGTYSSAAAVSADGTTAVGYSENTQAARHAFRWTEAGGLEDLEDLPFGSDDSAATGVSADGSVVVGAGSGSGAKAFRWTAADGMQELVESQMLSAAAGVSDDGTTTVGFSGMSIAVQRPTAWRPDGMGGFETDALENLAGEFSDGVAYAASADGSVVVGYSGPTPVSEAVLWHGAVATPIGDLPDGLAWSEARSVSADGTSVVGFGHSATGREAFRWTEAGGIVSLGDLPGGGVDSVAQAISADGSTIVGYAQPAPGVYHAFVWDAVHGMRDLHEVAGAEADGWVLYAANGVSGDGSVIVGEGTGPDGHPEAWLLRVPEPGAFAAALAGFAALGASAHVSRRSRG